MAGDGFEGELLEFDAKLLLEQATVIKVLDKVLVMSLSFNSPCSVEFAAINIPSCLRPSLLPQKASIVNR